MLDSALTSEEWDRGGRKLGVCSEVGATREWLRVELSDCGESEPITETLDGQDRHAIAALALYGQSFGFTREDVELLERCEATMGWKHEEEVRDLASRIAALLPPSAPPEG